jgi:hypothetical protein
LTKPDENRHVLTTAQQRALDLLAAGATVKEAAEGAGVSRQTCSAWLNHNPWFQAGLAQRREELWSGAKDRLRSMLPAALDAVERKLESEDEDSYKAGLSLLKLIGMGDAHLGNTGPTNPESIVDRLVRSRRPSSVDDLLADLGLDGGPPVTDRERREVLEELEELGAFSEHE